MSPDAGTATAATPPATYFPQTVASGVRASALRTPDKRALSEGERSLTYRHLMERTDQVAASAHARGLRRGDRVALVAQNCLEYLEIVMGLSSIGVGVVMVNPRLTAPEIEYIGRDSGAKAVFVQTALEDMIRGCDIPTVGETVVIGGDYDAWRDKARAAPPEVALAEWDVFALCYTAGTTGKPKGVMLSHRSRLLTFFGMAVEYGCYSQDDRALALAPMFHGAGFAFALAPISFGGYCEILPKFEPETVLKRLSENGLSNTFMVPTHFNALFALGQETLNRYRFPVLKTIISNAAPLPQATKERIVGYFGDGILHETYGSTEGGIVANLRPADQLRKKQCVGMPFPLTAVRLLDDAGNEVGPGEVGELFSTSPYLFNGYWGMPEATAECFRGPWLSVGDLAVRDEEGFLYIVDRKKDMIISGGVNIYPREIEEVLHKHPAIAEAAVVGVADDYWGEALKAFVVRRQGKVIESDGVLAHCRESLAGYKVPKSVVFVDALPRNAAGKVLKRTLRDS